MATSRTSSTCGTPALKKNEEIGIGPNQGPRQKGPNTGQDEHGVVHRVNDARWTGKNAEFFRITITPEGGM